MTSPGSNAGVSGKTWDSSDVLRIVALAFGFYLALKFLWLIQSLLIVSALGVIFGLALSGGVDLLVKRIPIPRGIAAALIVLLLFSALAGIGALLAPTLRDQTRELKEQLPAAMNRIEQWFTESGSGIAGILEVDQAGSDASRPPTAAQEGKRPAQRTGAPQTGMESRTVEEQETTSKVAGTLSEQLSSQIGGIMGFLFPFVSGTVAAVGALILMVFLAIYIAADPALYKRGLMHLFPHRARPRAEEVITEVGSALQRWLIARLIAMVVVGIVVTGALMLIGVRSAIALGVLAGLLEFIPFFGPIIAAVPAIGLAFAESPEKALYVVIAFLLVNQLEGNVLTPLLLQNRVDIPPALTVVAVAALGIVFGFLGLVIGEPLLVAVMVAIKMLYVEDVVGDDVMQDEQAQES